MNEYTPTIEDQAKRIWRICLECATTVHGLRPPNSRYANAAAELLFGTACQESGIEWERQRSPKWDGTVGGFSKWQLEHGSIDASITTLCNKDDLRKNATLFLFRDPKASGTWPLSIGTQVILWAMRLDDNDKIGALFARMHYFRVPAHIPYDITGQAEYWKRYYNTVAGAGTVEQYMHSWARFAPMRGI